MKIYHLKMYTTYADCPWNQDHKLLHVAMKAKELDRKPSCQQYGIPN